MAVGGYVIKLPVGACISIGDWVEHPRVDAGIVYVDGVSVVGGWTVGEVAGQMKTGSVTMSDARRPTNPALRVHDYTLQLRFRRDTYVKSDDQL